MSKHYTRGKTKNKLRGLYIWNANVLQGTNKNAKNTSVKTLIVRGIGYRAFALQNDLLTAKITPEKSFLDITRPTYTEISATPQIILSRSAIFEFPNERYLSIRAGHTRDMYLPLSNNVRCLTSKKDRKLVIVASNKITAANTAKMVYTYRKPSVYTGRGVRVKHIRPVRKAGKKDKQKGKAF